MSREIADRLRSIADALVSNEISDEAGAEVLGHLDAAHRIIDSFPHGSLYRVIPKGMPTMHLMEGAAAAEAAGSTHPFRLHSPIVGVRNPEAPPAVFTWSDERVIGTCTYGARYEGAPGCVHGGFIAAVFDDCLGIAQGLSGQGGMTAFLNVQYRRPHLLHRLIKFEAWVESVNGRKILCRGTSTDTDTGEPLAECEALFLSIDWAKIREAAVDRLM